MVVPSLQEALRASIAGYIGARIGTVTMDTDTGRTSRRTDMDTRSGVGTTGTMDTDTGRTSRRTDMDTCPPAMAITSNPILGMAIGNGGSSDRAISIIGEALRAARM